MTRKRSMLTQQSISRDEQEVRLTKTLLEYRTARDKHCPCVFRNVQTKFNGRATAETIKSAMLRFTINRLEREFNLDDETMIRTLLKVPSTAVIRLAVVRVIPVEKS